MAESLRTKEQLSAGLARVISLRRALARDPEMGDKWLAVKRFQSALMRRLFADLLRQPRYAPAGEFFLNEIYGARDFEQRDSEMLRVVPKLARMLPQRAVHTLALAVEVDQLSEQLDLGIAELVRVPISDADYAGAFARFGRRADRARQLALIEEIGHSLDQLARIPLLAPLLHMMRAPAYAAGLEHLQRFLQDGFDAFRAMNGATEFLEAIRARQTRVVDTIFGGGTIADVFSGAASG